MNFPPLKTGAVMQYPAQRATIFSTQVLQFIDGTEQRFPAYAAPRRQWMLRLDLLDEAEISSLSRFFTGQNGAAGVFSFSDPWDGTVYPSCSFVGDGMVAGFDGGSRSKTTLTIRENCG
jgi:hypothetical protein